MEQAAHLLILSRPAAAPQQSASRLSGGAGRMEGDQDWMKASRSALMTSA
jgi:hypothetical protein